jgi:hypothetical protein
MVLVSQYLFKNNWVITFSVCLFYFGLIHSFFIKLIFGEQEITEMDFVLDDDRNKKNKLVAKIALVVIFFIGSASYFGYLYLLDKQEKEARRIHNEESAIKAADFERRMDEEIKEAGEVYSVGFGMPNYVYQEKDVTAIFNDGSDKNEGDAVKVKGVVKDWVPEKFMRGFAPEDIDRFALNKNLRLSFYVSKYGYYANNRYYVLCDSLYGAHVGEIVEVDGVISNYNIYRDDNLKDAVSKCVMPVSEVKIIDKEPLKKRALRSYRNKAEFLKRAAKMKFGAEGADPRDSLALNKFKDNIDDYDNVSYYWIEDKKEYEVLLSYDLDGHYRLYFGFFIGEDLKTRELEIFMGSGI